MQSVTAQHLPRTGFLPLDLSHLCLHSHISRICHRSHLPAIMWKKYRKRAACISSIVFLPQHSWATQTPMLKTTSLIPTPEKQLESHHEPQQILSRYRNRNLQTPLAQEEFGRWGTASQVPKNISPARRLWALQRARPHWKLTQKCCPGKIIVNFGVVQDSWASVGPGESYLCSLLPKYLLLQSPGPPWPCKSRLAVPVLPVTPALSSISSFALDLYSSFTLRHKIWCTLKASNLMHMCSVPSDQTYPEASILLYMVSRSRNPR